MRYEWFQVPTSLRSRIRPRNNGCLARSNKLFVCWVGDSGTKMRFLLAIIVSFYLVGVGVVLVADGSIHVDTETASALTDHVIQALPNALAWPVRAASTPSERQALIMVRRGSAPAEISATFASARNRVLSLHARRPRRDARPARTRASRRTPGSSLPPR